MRYPGLNALLSDPFAPVHGNTFVWKGFAYKVVVRDYGANGKLAWLDRNLGASRAAQSRLDSLSFGGFYQWGRLTDGHQLPDSATTSTLATSDVPDNDGKFITTSAAPNDWRDPQNDNLWQGADGTNNPAPPGWRVPTQTEANREIALWDSEDFNGAYDSALKLPTTGGRGLNGSAVLTDRGYIWLSTTINTNSRMLDYRSNLAQTSGQQFRAVGYPVRCVRTI